MRYPIKDNSGDGEWTRWRSLPTGTHGEPAPLDININIMLYSLPGLGHNTVTQRQLPEPE